MTALSITAHEPVDDLIEAEGLGYRDWNAGIYCPPAEFNNHPQLLRYWAQGQDVALDSAVLDQCDLCNSSDGLPCGVHG